MSFARRTTLLRRGETPSISNKRARSPSLEFPLPPLFHPPSPAVSEHIAPGDVFASLQLPPNAYDPQLQQPAPCQPSSATDLLPIHSSQPLPDACACEALVKRYCRARRTIASFERKVQQLEASEQIIQHAEAQLEEELSK